jgi:hypothetical protein
MKYFLFGRLGNKTNEIKNFKMHFPNIDSITTIVEPFGGSFAVIRCHYINENKKFHVNDTDEKLFDVYKNYIKFFPTGANETIEVVSVNQSTFGNKILPTTFIVSSSTVLIVDDGYGNLLDIKGATGTYINDGYFNVAGYFTDNVPQPDTYIGNIFYAQGTAVITNQSYQSVLSSPDWDILFRNEQIIYEHEVRCLVKESDYNLSYNPSLVTGSYTGGIVRDFATGSDFYTYATSLGLYNDNNELLAVAKFGKPMLISPDTDMTFVVKYDT